MTAATRTRRHLHPVPDLADIPTLAVPATVIPANRSTALAEAHDTATEAAFMPDVVADQGAAITRLMQRLAEPGNDIHALLRDFGRAMYVHGHMDATANLTTGLVLAEIHSLEAHTRQETDQ